MKSIGKVVSFMNMKGGVCKTTLCANIANTLVTRFNKKVLVVDMDPQFNATQYILGVVKNDYMPWYKELKNDGKTIYNLHSDDKGKKELSDEENKTESVKSLFNTNHVGEYYLKENYIVTIKNNFDMILGDIDLIELQIVQKDSVSKRLSKYIEYNNLRDKYDYILIDCPPTYSFFFIASYIASDTYVIPVKPDYVSALGLSLLHRAISSIEDKSQDVKCSGIIYTLISTRNKIHEPVIQEIENSVGRENIFSEPIKDFVDIPKGVEEGKFMLDIVNNNISSSICKITEEFIARTEGQNEQ